MVPVVAPVESYHPMNFAVRSGPSLHNGDLLECFGLCPYTMCTGVFQRDCIAQTEILAQTRAYQFSANASLKNLCYQWPTQSLVFHWSPRQILPCLFVYPHAPHELEWDSLAYWLSQFE